MIAAARLLPGGADLSLEDTSEDLEELASAELRAAVQIIEDATNALIAAKPQPKVKRVSIISPSILHPSIHLSFSFSSTHFSLRIAIIL